MTRTALGPLVLDILDKNFICSRIEKIILNRVPSQIVTLNSLMFNFAYEDPVLCQSICNAAVVIPDSIGIVWATKFLTGQSTRRYAGIDLFDNLCSMSQKSSYSIFFLGSKPGIAEDTAYKIRQEYPDLKIAGTHHGYFSEQENDSIIERVRSSNPDILFVGLDVPRQEKWISSNLAKLNVPVVMGVGGSFDVISGHLMRAPKWLQKVELEWFFRFIQQPWRIIRIKDLPLFVINIIKIKIQMNTKSMTNDQIPNPN